MLDVDTSNVFALRRAAQLHMREGVGLKYQAVLWPFSTLDGYNNAAALYQGPPELFAWQYSPVTIIRMLNLEYARLQRLQQSVEACSSSENQDPCQTMKLLVSHFCEGQMSFVIPSSDFHMTLMLCGTACAV